jgi:hypothetical protein
MRRLTVIGLLAAAAIMPHPALGQPRVTFTKWSLQISGVNATHPPGEAQPTCSGDELGFAGIAGRYHGFPSGSTVSGVFALDGRKVGFAGPYTTAAKGTFGFTWQPKPPLSLSGVHTMELRFFEGKKLIARSRQRFAPGDC